MNKYLMIYGVMKSVYGAVLRDLMIEAIDDPEKDIDDFVVQLLDTLFDYGGK